MSLRILKGLPLQDFPEARIGIMAHGNTTANFQRAYRNYPCDDLDHCDAVDGPCQFPANTNLCPVRTHILAHTIKMCDSGIFTREGATLTYTQLFDTYTRMGVQFGIMIDVFCDAQATIVSAEEALKYYEPYRQMFDLVGVAQGTNLEEYLDCYAQLRELGFKYIAVGGLLRRRTNTVRSVYLRGEEFMLAILRDLREQYPDDWLFALGTFHPTRLATLQELAVWADYKGWIFQYEKRNDTLNTLLTGLATNHLEHVEESQRAVIKRQTTGLQRLIAQRDVDVAQCGTLSQQLYEGRRTLRSSLLTLHTNLSVQSSPLAHQIATLATHGLQDDSEERQVTEALIAVAFPEQEKNAVLDNIRQNRQVRADIRAIERKLDISNAAIKQNIDRLLLSAAALPTTLQEFCAKIVELIQVSERDYRFRQVRTLVTTSILAQLPGSQQGRPEGNSDVNGVTARS